MNRRASLILAVMGICIAALTACTAAGRAETGGAAAGGAETSGAAAKASLQGTAQESRYPVELTLYDDNGGEIHQTIEKEPRRVVVIGQGLAELMIYFGQEDKIVGLAYLDKSYSKYEEQIKKLPLLSDMWPSKESVLALKPDLIVAMSSAFHDDRLGDISFWNQRGIPVVTGINYTIGRTVGSFFDDIRNIGTALNVTDRTNAFIEDQQTRIQAIQEKSKGAATKPRVLLFAGGQDQTYWYYGPGLCLIDEMVEGSSGEYIKVSEDSFVQMSAESILSVNPDKIIVTEFRKSHNDTAKALLSDPALKNVAAIKSGDVITVDYTNAIRGSTELADLYEQVANFVHPELFE